MTMAASPPNFEAEQRKILQFFEPRLEAIGLGLKDLEKQTLVELDESLERVNDALRSHESFGILRYRATPEVGFVITKPTESQFEVGVVPLLLERKKFILDRRRKLQQDRPINTLRDLIDSIAEESLRSRLVVELESMRERTAPTGEADPVGPDTAFVAMSMDPENPQLEDVLDAIKNGARECGVVAERIDEQTSNERITDRMIEAIRRAEFVIVDLTYAKPNVYYEAGYAQGFGKTPIYVASKSTAIHFDVRDYPVVFFANMKGLRTALAERLRAVKDGVRGSLTTR